MLDIFLEGLRIAVIVAILAAMVPYRRRALQASRRGWWLVVVGLGLMIMVTVADITSDPRMEAVVIGYVAGVVVTAIGLSLYAPVIRSFIKKANSIEESFEVAEGRFRSAFEHAPIAMVLTDARNGRVLQVNSAMCRLLGYSVEKFAELTWADVTHPEDYEEFVHLREQLIEGPEESGSIEQRFMGSDGHVVVTETSISTTHDSRGNPIYLIAQLVDITESREANERLEELVRSKDEFLASVSHELRTPLTAVLGYARLMQQDGSALSSDQTDMIHSIAEQAFDLSSIVDDLLVAARADLGILTVTSVPVRLAAQAAQVIENYDPGAVDRVKVVGESGHATGDPKRVRQILRNLISNALRYGGEDIQVITHNSGTTARVLVTDDGPGIEHAQRDLIFKPYHRAHDDPGITDSMGLGLAVSRQLAQLMGGDLTYRYQNSRSIFELSLPAVEPTTQPRHKARSRTRPINTRS